MEQSFNEVPSILGTFVWYWLNYLLLSSFIYRHCDRAKCSLIAPVRHHTLT